MQMRSIEHNAHQRLSPWLFDAASGDGVFNNAVGATFDRLLNKGGPQDWGSIIWQSAGQAAGNALAGYAFKPKVPKIDKPSITKRANATFDEIQEVLINNPSASSEDKQRMLTQAVQAGGNGPNDSSGNGGKKAKAGFDFDVDDGILFFDYQGDKGGGMQVDLNQIDARNVHGIRTDILNYIDEYSAQGSSLAWMNTNNIMRNIAFGMQKAHDDTSVKAFATQQYVHAQTEALYDLSTNVVIGSVTAPFLSGALAIGGRGLLAFGQGVTQGTRFVVGGIANSASIAVHGIRSSFSGGFANGMRSIMPAIGSGVTTNLPAWAVVGEFGVSGIEIMSGAEIMPSVNDAWKVGVKQTGRAVDFISQVTTTGRRGGNLYSSKKLQQLGPYLAKRGIELRVGDKFVPPGKAGGFDSENGVLFLRSDPTEYEVWHELSHFRQYQKIGRQAYLELPRTKAFNAPEQFVFDMLENSPKRWDALNFEEQQHAINYIEYIGGFR